MLLKQKLHYLLLLLFLIPATLQAQTPLTVDSFTEKTSDLSASTQSREDNNRVPCALVKVRIAASGVKFEGNVMGDVAYKTSEYWVYMPKGSKRLTVKLEGYLPLDVEFAQYGINSLESKLTYQLVISGIVVSGEAPRQQTGWLILNSTPSEAEVYLKINGVESLEGSTPFQKKLAYGSYEYRLSKNLYHDEVGVVEVNKSQVELTPFLKPAHGRISVTTNPADAKVVIEGLRESYTTPCTTDILPSGEYQLSISKAQYAAATRTVTVRDGAVTPLHIDLSANYAQVTVNSLPQAEIYLNGAKVSTATYTANLSPGIYDFEARLDGHHAAKRQVEVESNMPRTFTLNPKPFCGSLDVISNPMKASVTIDGKHYGQTPITIDNLPIGERQVVLALEGYASETATVTIEDGKTAELNRTLSTKGKKTQPTSPSKNDSKPEKQPTPSTENKKDSRWFILANAMPTSNISDGLKQPAFGLTIGRVKTFGWYVTVMSNFVSETSEGNISSSEGLTSEGDLILLTGDKSVSFFQATAGAAYQLSDHFRLTAGVGYTARTLYLQGENDLYYESEGGKGVCLELGACVSMGPVDLEVDICSPALMGVSMKLGLGVNF